jgi:hypothetical protein
MLIKFKKNGFKNLKQVTVPPSDYQHLHTGYKQRSSIAIRTECMYILYVEKLREKPCMS